MTLVTGHVAEPAAGGYEYDVFVSYRRNGNVGADHDDENMLRAATADLELLGPVRVSGLGSQQTTEVPAELRERIERLIGRLEG